MHRLAETLRELRTDKFPVEGIEHLWEQGLLSTERIEELNAPTTGSTPRMFGILKEIGRGDLALGRLYEGHVNAVGLIARYGRPTQKARATIWASAGRLLGVWGADDGARPGRLRGGTLSGRKTYASGADKLAAAIIVVKDDEERSRMALVPTTRLEGRFDPSWWRPIGMTTTDSYALDAEGLELEAGDLVGQPMDYLAQPYFGGGALRFVTVQLGGLLAVWDAVVAHLTRTGRASDPVQGQRLGTMLGRLEAIHAGVQAAYERLGAALAGEGAEPDASLIADAARTLTYQGGGEIMEMAVRCVGCQGLMTGHDLDRALRDLTVYLRQPAPDAAMMRAVTGVIEGRYRPLFDV